MVKVVYCFHNSTSLFHPVHLFFRFNLSAPLFCNDFKIVFALIFFLYSLRPLSFSSRILIFCTNHASGGLWLPLFISPRSLVLLLFPLWMPCSINISSISFSSHFDITAKPSCLLRSPMGFLRLFMFTCSPFPSCHFSHFEINCAQMQSGKEIAQTMKRKRPRECDLTLCCPRDL